MIIGERTLDMTAGFLELSANFDNLVDVFFAKRL